MSNEKIGSLVFFIRRSAPSIGNEERDLEVLLGKKHRRARIGPNTWNGPGGGVKLWLGETPEQAAIREIREEFGKSFKVKKRHLKSRGIITFFRHDMRVMMKVHIFVCYRFSGQPKKTREMSSHTWYKASQLSTLKMMPADGLFIPTILGGETIPNGLVVFSEGLLGVSDYSLKTAPHEHE